MPDGCRHLGAALGTAPFVEEYLADRVSGFLGQVNKLCEFAESQPQVAYHALVNGLQSKWTFLCRTVEGAAEALKPLEEDIGWLVGWYILFYFARMNRHCCLLAWTSGLSKLSQKDEERKEILHESVKHANL